MTDSRPSENTDDSLDLQEMRRRGFFDDVPAPAPAEEDPVEDMVERAKNAHSTDLALVYAQIATVRQMQKLTAAIVAATTYEFVPLSMNEGLSEETDR